MNRAAVTTVDVIAPRARPVEARPSTGRVALALARVEGRRLLRSPAALVGFVLVVLPALGWRGVPVHDLRVESMEMVFHAFPMAAGALIAANLATSRSRRHRTEELFSSTPAEAEARTGGHVLSAAWPTAAALIIFAALIAAAASGTSFGRPDGAEVLVGPVLVAGAAVLGVMVARWVPTPVAIPITLIAIAAVQIPLSGTSILDRGWRRLGFWTYPGDLVLELLPPRLARWHLIYLVGLVAMAAVGAFLAHGFRRRVVVAGALAVAVVVTAAWFQTRPLSPAGWAARNALVDRPQDYQVCETRNGIRYCSYPAYRGLIDVWAPRVAAVLRAAPAGQWPAGAEVSQRVSPSDRYWVDDATLARELPALPLRASAGTSDGNVHPPVRWEAEGTTELGLALSVASLAVSLPVDPAERGTLCDAAGQGRAVVAAWLAGQASDDVRSLLRELAAGQWPATHIVVPWAWGMSGGVAWGTTEIGQALSLLERPEAEVRARVMDDWSRLTAPGVSTAEVSARLALPLPAPAAESGAGRLFDGPGRYEVAEHVRLGGPCPTGRVAS